MELLRIVAMVMVLVCHIDFHAVGTHVPDCQSVVGFSVEGLTRIFFSSLSKCCVIVFILISGWFSIRPSVKGAVSFLFQCLFYTLSGYAVMVLSGAVPGSPMGFLRCFWLGESCWFEKSYFALYILAPVINRYIDYCDRRGFGRILFAFIAFQIIYGLTGSTAYINQGYSAFTFIAIYMMGRYARLYLAERIESPGMIYMACTFANMILFIALSRRGMEWLPMSYVNPLVILQGVALLLWFNNLKLGYNRHINHVARSAFAVYLLHTCPAIWTPVFIPLCMRLHTNYNGIGYLLMAAATIFLIFIAAIILDGMRRSLYERIAILTRTRNVTTAN